MITFFRENELNQKFLADLKTAIVGEDKLHKRKGSNSYKPSSFACDRQMYFIRTDAEQDNSDGAEYNAIGMANCGTGRHVDLQRAMAAMPELGLDWEYVDVAQYLNEKHADGKCLDVIADRVVGMETHLTAKVKGGKGITAPISFMCDGIIKQKSTGKYFLLEIKNQLGIIANQHKVTVDPKHLAQITTYCWLLDLDTAFVVYENRDTCELYCPQLIVTPAMKEKLKARILTVEQHVKDQKIPPMADDIKSCKWCPYKTLCKNVGTVSDMPPV